MLHHHNKRNIALIGESGRMGKSIIERVSNDDSWCIHTKIMRDLSAFTNVINNDTPEIDIIIDFSNAELTHQLASHAINATIPMLIGTTGLSMETYDLLNACAQTAPIMIAPNTSTGILVLHKLLTLAARHLDESFDIDIIETHHRHKKDAPSGTTLSLRNTLMLATEKPITLHSIRAGKNTAEHTVTFNGDNESLTLSHNVSSSAVFADGALRLAQWLLNQKSGLYTPKDFLNVSY